jgi:serine/threonine protein phosphatase PrpC
MERRPRIECHAVSDRGRVRTTNEDQFLVGDLARTLLIGQTSLSREDHSRLVGDPLGKLLVVADGMGGMGGGSLASSVAVDTLVGYVLNAMPWFFGLDEKRQDDLADELKAAVERCQAAVERAAGEDHAPMGTTLTMAYVLWPRAYVLHVGDSRCYVFRAGHVLQVTRDQTMAQRLADSGVLDGKQAAESSWKDVLWSAIGGGESELAPEVYKVHLEAGDALLLCTDGLTKHVGDDEIAAVLAGHASAEDACVKLVGLAKAAGGSDNVTVAVAAIS